MSTLYKLGGIVITLTLFAWVIATSLPKSYADLIADNFVTISMKHKLLQHNPVPYIPSQCYTKVKDGTRTFNPCYSCHINNGQTHYAPNYYVDASLQLAYDFPTPARKNHFSNLFKDRTALIEMIDDNDMRRYIQTSNYFSDKQTITLANKLQKSLPKAWDVNENSRWDGYVPDCYFNFDAQGFDHTPSNAYTGWRAFRYRPFLGTFWPTNGSTDDVLIRLAKPFQQDSTGDFNLTIYKINLAIVEALIKQEDIAIDPIDEHLLNEDIDRNGKLNVASQVVFKKPFGVGMRYVGKAHDYLEDSPKNIARGLYPEGTEFLHSVRYLQHTNREGISLAPRMKELRWAKKISYNTYGQLQSAAMAEIKERHDFPERTKKIIGDTEKGVHNGLGWVYQGFIEDKKGALRPQNFEETAYCIGCHGSIGATVDNSFAFRRKLSGDASWQHWTQQGLDSVTDKVIGANKTEYHNYLRVNGAGDEFRTNQEIMKTFFDANGSLNALAKDIKKDISLLLLPSKQRAMQLNKAYKIIVDEQSFVKGRDAHIKPLHKSVLQHIQGDTTGITTIESY